MAKKTAAAAAEFYLVDQGDRVSGEKSPLLDEVYKRLKDEIFEFRMPPGQRYSEHELAAAFGVSRTPLRLALHILAREGYLVRLEGHSSWQVKPLDLSYYEDLYDFRMDLEALAVRRLCKMDPMPSLSELCGYWLAPKPEPMPDFKEVAHEDECFHRTLIALAGNQEMLRTFNMITDKIRIIRRLDFMNSERIAATFDEHRKILGTLLTRKAERAEMLIRSHITSSRTEIRHITLHRLALASSQTVRKALS